MSVLVISGLWTLKVLTRSLTVSDTVKKSKASQVCCECASQFPMNYDPSLFENEFNKNMCMRKLTQAQNATKKKAQ